jgi:hypothetical protein
MNTVAIHLSTVFGMCPVKSPPVIIYLVFSRRSHTLYDHRVFLDQVKEGGPASNGWADQCPRSVDVPDRHARRSLARKSLGLFCAQLIEFLSSAMLNLIFSQAFPGAESIISTIFNMALPKLYAISMMWTLNARRTIRTAHTSGINTSSNEISGGRLNSRAPRRGNVSFTSDSRPAPCLNLTPRPTAGRYRARSDTGSYTDGDAHRRTPPLCRRSSSVFFSNSCCRSAICLTQPTRRTKLIGKEARTSQLTLNNLRDRTFVSGQFPSPFRPLHFWNVYCNCIIKCFAASYVSSCNSLNSSVGPRRS